ncbi:MAG: hypothetical protein P1P74_11690 [Desulfuromonadales bacterium]|nr:hypothetical protein [Desulfuromonadales bacterium]MDT8424255.1 hypothetical protein [Desulfuromonadales bacterium]
MNTHHACTPCNETHRPGVHWNCPYYCGDKIDCRAATSTNYLNRRVRMRFCLSDNYENCAVFLAKVLRGGHCVKARRATIIRPTRFDK